MNFFNGHDDRNEVFAYGIYTVIHKGHYVHPTCFPTFSSQELSAAFVLSPFVS